MLRPFRIDCPDVTIIPTLCYYLLQNRPSVGGRLSWLADLNSPSDKVSVTCSVVDAVINGEEGDAMTQSCALDLWAATLPHIDSDVSDDDDDGYCCYDSREYATGLIVSQITGVQPVILQERIELPAKGMTL